MTSKTSSTWNANPDAATFSAPKRLAFFFRCYVTLSVQFALFFAVATIFNLLQFVHDFLRSHHLVAFVFGIWWTLSLGAIFVPPWVSLGQSRPVLLVMINYSLAQAMFFAAVAVSFGHQALFYSSFYVLVGCLWAVLMYGLLEVDAHTFQGVWLVFVLTSVLGGISLADLRHDDSLGQMFDVMLGFALAIFFLTQYLAYNSQQLSAYKFANASPHQSAFGVCMLYGGPVAMSYYEHEMHTGGGNASQAMLGESTRFWYESKHRCPH